MTDIRQLARVALEIRKAASALAASDLLQDLGDIQLSMMASAGKRRTHKRYNFLFREGSPATCFYILRGGTLHERSLDGSVDRTLHVDRKPEAPFILFGTEALFGRPRASTVSALEDLDVIKFSATDMNLREDGAAKVARKVFNAYIEGELMAMSLFRGITLKQLKQVVPLFGLEEVAAGQTIFRQGAPGDKVFIILHGSVEMRKGKQRIQQLTAQSGSSNTSLPVFGEMALLDRSPRTASALAVVDCKFLVLPQEQFAAASLILPDIKPRLRRIKEERKHENVAAAAAEVGGGRSSPEGAAAAAAVHGSHTATSAARTPSPPTA